MKYLPDLRGRLQAEFLAEVANIIAASFDRDAVLRRCMEELQKIVEFDTVTVALFSDGIEWEFAVGVGYEDESYTKGLSAKNLKDSPVLKRMAKDLKPVIRPDVRHFSDWQWIAGAEHVRSFMAVPMITLGQMIGVMMLDSSKVDFFSQDDLTLVTTLSRTLAVAVEKIRLYEAMEQRISQQDALLAASKAVSSSLELEVVLSKLVEQMAKAIDVTSAYISDYDPEYGTTTSLAEYIGPEASERERVSDIGLVYDIAEDLGEDQASLSFGETLIEHVDDPNLTAPSKEHYIEYGVKSVMILPLIVREQIVGFADLWESRRHREFTTAEIALTQAIAQHAAFAIENAQLFAEKKEQLRLAETLQEVGALLTTRLSLSEVFEQIFALLAQVVAYDSASVQLLDTAGNVYVAAGTGVANLEPYRAFAGLHGNRIIERFSQQENVKVIPDTDLTEDWIHVPGLSFVRSWIGAALMVKDHLIGVLNVDSSKANTYNQRIGETVLTFANQAAVAIENARLYDETRHRANEMMVLHRVALATTVLPDVDSLLEQTTKLVAANLYEEHFGFLLAGEEAEHLIPHSSFHGAPVELLNEPIPIDSSICGFVYKTGQPIIVGNVFDEEKYHQVSARTVSEISVPLIVRNKGVGVINVESSRLNAFSNNDLRFLTTLAGQVATFIERTDLYQAQRRYTAHLALEVGQRTAALRAERDRMQAILDNAGEGIFFTDAEGVILYVNSMMTKVTGFSVNELLHRSPNQWPGISEAPDLKESLERAIREAKEWRSELVGKRKDSRTYDIYLTVAPIFSNEGTLSGLVGVHSDISYLKEVERLKGRFIANVSHELRTPLTVIETYTTLLKQGDSNRRDYYLSILSQETKRLAQLIQDVLDLSRLEMDSTPVLMGSVQIGPILQQVVSTFLPHAENKRISLQLELSQTLPSIWANLMQVEQVITNLVNNALIYTLEMGNVLVKAGKETKHNEVMLCISVEDDGPGIPEDDLPLVFDRFFRSQRVEEEAIRGTGLGLAICKEIVERHNGYIEAKSEVGQGTVFMVWLPVEETTEDG